MESFTKKLKKQFNFVYSVGSGKSSFFHALIGDMNYDEELKPELYIQGQICYVPQKPWIMSGTVKENILFHSEYDEGRFAECIKYACLERDLSILNNGIETMIGFLFFVNLNFFYILLIFLGEKGANLSGGQKARINLARALYSNKNIILLDDPLRFFIFLNILIFFYLNDYLVLLMFMLGNF